MLLNLDSNPIILMFIIISLLLIIRFSATDRDHQGIGSYGFVKAAFKSIRVRALHSTRHSKYSAYLQSSVS